MGNFTFRDGWWLAEVDIPLLKQRLPVHIVQENGEHPTPRQIQVFDSLQSLPVTLLEEIDARIEQYYQSTAENTDLDYADIRIDPNQLDQHYQFSSIQIPELGQCDVRYIFILGECDWEPEHGMEIMVEDNHAFYCGDYLGIIASEWWKRIIAANPELRKRIWDEFFDIR